MNIYIRPGTSYTAPLLYTFRLIGRHQSIDFNFIAAPESADLIFDHGHAQSQKMAWWFYNKMIATGTALQHTHVFKGECLIRTEEGLPDYLSSIFYMVNALQEYNPDEQSLDRFQRFRYEASFQYTYNNIDQNLVQQYINLLLDEWKLKGQARKSAFFVSHDIDVIYGSLTEDGLWAVKKGRLDIALKLIANEILRRPDWKNIDRVMKINSEYDVRSTFFWIVNKGKGELGIKNADYDIRKEQKLLTHVREKGFVNGLHKSCSPMGLNEELDKGKIDNPYNRYHFLRFLPHTDWPKINASRITFDASLGFAERYGFRNAYGLPFQPFDIQNNRPYTFIEAPLNFMDGTFHKYMKIPKEKIADTVIDFYEKNRLNCVFSLLWHNTYFTQYKYRGFITQYKKILSYLHESGIQCLNPAEMIAQNSIPW